MTIQIEPEAFSVRESADGSLLRLGFVQGDQDLGVVIPKDRLPTLLSVLHERADTGSLVPLRQSALQTAPMVSLKGWKVAPGEQEGAVTLTLFMELASDGRIVSLPLDFPPSEWDRLQADILRRTKV